MFPDPRRLALLVLPAVALLGACSGTAADEVAEGPTTTVVIVSEVGQRRPWDGMILPPDAGTGYDPASVDVDLGSLAALGAPNVAFVVPLPQPDPAAVPRRDSDATPDDETLGEAMATATELGLGTVLELRVESPTGATPAPSDTERWFEEYGRLALHYAEVADRHDASLLVIGGTGPDLADEADRWRALIRDIRRVYDGPLSFSVEADHVERVTFWDAVDVIGVDTDFPEADVLDPIAADIEKAWEPVLSELTELAERWDRPVVLTHVGYPGVEGTTAGQLGIAEERQLEAYEALFTVANQTPAVEGLLVWRWGSDPIVSGGEGAGFSPRDRLAEAVLRRAWATPLPGDDDDLGEDPELGADRPTPFDVEVQSSSAARS